MKRILLLFLIILLPSCYHYQLKIDKEICNLNNIVYDKINLELENDSAECPDQTKQLNIEELLSRPITRNEAITIALLNNKFLQAAFEDIGVTKADLVQSGLLSNPELATLNGGLYTFPARNSNINTSSLVPDLQLQPLITLSDFWQIPFNIRVQRDQLALTLFNIFDLIINTIKAARKAYDNLLFTNNQIILTKDILEDVHEHLKKIRKKEKEKEKEKEDGDTKDVLLVIYKFDAQLRSYNGKKNAALAELKNVLGLEDYFKNIEQEDKLNYFHRNLEPVEKLIEYAVNNRPDMLFANKKIQLQEDTLTYEKSKSFKELKGGLYFERTTTNDKLLGPSFTAKLPYFDYNQAQIAKAKYNLEKAKKELIAKRIKVKTEVYQNYVNYIAYLEQVEIYDKKLMPVNEIIIQNILKSHEESRGSSQVSLLQSETPIYETKFFLLDLYHNTLDSFTDLENSVGKRLDIELPQIDSHNDCNDCLEYN